MAVHHAMVPRRGEVHDPANDHVAVVNDGTVLGVVNAQDADLRLVDDGRGTEPAQATKAGDGEGGSGQVVHAGFSVSGGLRHSAHLGR